ncbi:SWIM zinc finger domain-containing protein [Chitinophaga sp. GbtcB8]|uniref:SWIM zinc finger family protein n=1 Tax=Chitinophaga sp. GbtcB8 TaxID=2824753 RepID=UPI001C30F7A4|nr:SWIM zinc finger family protein [Chitinophaga sp. GbtcB8]
MLTLKNFEIQLNETILKRGKQYYEDGAVTDLEETGKNIWQAKVMGSATYTVEIKFINKNKIEDHSCDCPYDGGTCKHIAAVLFRLKEALTNTKTKQPGKPDFKTLLQKISLEEYQEFMLAHAAKDKNFRSVFELWFAHKDSRIDTGKKHTDLIKSIIRKNTTQGYIDYRAAYSLANEINKLLDRGDDLILKHNFRDAFILARAALKEVIELVAYSDDSTGSIGDIISRVIQLIENAAEAKGAAIALKEQIFVFIHTELGNQIYFDYGDFGYEMINIYQRLAIQLNKEETFLNYLDARLTKLSAEEHAYKKNAFLVLKIGFLKAIGKANEIATLVQQNLDIVEIRQGEVDSAIDKKDFPLAKKLIAEGIKIAKQKGHPGVVSEWEKELLRIAVLEEDKETIRHYTKYFAFDRWFNRDYYIQWRKTFTTPEWKEVIEKYIEEKINQIDKQYQKNKGKVWYSPDLLLLDSLAPIYVEEKYWDRLLALISKEADLDRILQYHNYLVKEYPLELLAIYLPAFERKGDTAGNRGEYTNLAGKMKTIIKSIPEGKEKIIAIARNLNQKYPRRPAMVEELNKVIAMDKG